MASARRAASLLLALFALATAAAGAGGGQRRGRGHTGHAGHVGGGGLDDRAEGLATTPSPTPPMVEQSTWDPCECGKGVACVCVMYYLCNPATGTIYTYGEDVLDERFQLDKLDKCPGTLQMCCRVPTDLLQGGGGEGGGGGQVTGVAVRPPLPSTPQHPHPKPPPPLSPPQGPESPPRTSGPGEWECGVRRTDFALLDVWARVDDRESDEVAFAEFPWTLVLLHADGGGWLGGASLVRPNVALTAAHTVQGVEPERIRVRAGEWDAAALEEPLPHQERVVTRVVLHPAFVRRALFHDAALLQLEEAFEPAPHVAPVCLPPPSASFDGRRCVATGWGADAPDKESTLRRLLRRVDLPVVARSQCETLLRTTRLGIFFHLHESFMCAGAENGRDTCKGDGGGPLVCQSAEDPRRYEQAGIVSWGIGCADPKVPAVYTDVAKLRPWLDEQLAVMSR